MEKFTRITAVAAPLLRINIDTDAIIPSREMKTVGKTGLAAGLFANWRYRTPGSRDEAPDFVLNREPYRHARILLAGANFGCGSSREHAVWALHEWGVRNGILPVVLDNAVVEDLARQVEGDASSPPLTVDLVERTVTAPDGARHAFAINDTDREMLLEGLDGIAHTLKRDDAILAFQAQDRLRRPWIYL